MAALDDQIGIGADEGQMAGDKLLQLGAIVLGRFLLVVAQARADDNAGLFRRDGLDAKAVEQRLVLPGADEIDLLRPRRRSARGSRRRR